MEQLDTLYVVSWTDDMFESNEEYDDFDDARADYINKAQYDESDSLTRVALYRVETNWNDYEEHTLLDETIF